MLTSRLPPCPLFSPEGRSVKISVLYPAKLAAFSLGTASLLVARAPIGIKTVQWSRLLDISTVDGGILHIRTSCQRGIPACQNLHLSGGSWRSWTFHRAPFSGMLLTFTTPARSLPLCRSGGVIQQGYAPSKRNSFSGWKVCFRARTRVQETYHVSEPLCSRALAIVLA